MSALPKPVVKLAMEILKDRRATFAAHDEARTEWAREGHRPHYCVHGTNMWTDYDPMCGPCEDGLGYWDYLPQAEDCLGIARAAYAEFMRRQELIMPLFKADAPVSTELCQWVSLPLTTWSNR